MRGIGGVPCCITSFLWLLQLQNPGISAQSSIPDVLSYVDPLIGSDNGGNVFAGATLPYGMAKAVADVDGQNTCGFSTDGSNVTGFSHMHDSGTGGNPSMGNFPLFLLPYCPGDDIDNCHFSKPERATHYVNDSVKASPGYFSVGLVNGVSAEMTVSNRTALYRFTVPSSTPDGSPVSPLMILDLTDLYDSRQNATVNVDADSGRITANGTFLPSFGSGQFKSYVCADFQGATVRDTGVYVNDRAGTYPKTLFVERGINLFYIEAGGIVRFNAPQNSTLTARVGVSLISTEQACSNAEKEIPDWDFDGIRSAAEDAWRDKLNVITMDSTGLDNDLLRSFWSGVYRTMISPQDYTGENPLWQSTEPYFDSFYCLWDEFRAQLPLLTIIDPMAESMFVRSLIDTYKHVGWLPDCRMSLSKGFTQGGSNADVVLVDGYVKSLPGIDWESAYQAIVNDAENEPLDWSVEGRGGSISWKSLNYIPYLDYDYLGFGTNSRSISRTVEYSYNDYCVASLAQSLGHTDDFNKYATRAGSWQNLFLPNQTSALFNGTDTGFVGFFQPKFLNRTFGFMDPVMCSDLDTISCSLTSNPTEVFESSIWEYQFYVPHQNAQLISLLGGPDTFVRRLDYLHTSGLIDIGNEPSFLTVYQYNYAGQPGGSARRAHYYIPSAFNSTTAGLPGNDDSGAMGSFLAFSMTGVFPNPGQNVYLIGSPFFPSITFTSKLTGANATIVAHGLDPPTYSNIYVQNATLNGTAYTKNWIGHEFFLYGGTLELTMGNAESAWGTQPGDIPPSFQVPGGNVTARGMRMGEMPKWV